MIRRPRALRRSVLAVVAAAAVLGSATACEVRTGAAAFVGDDRIAESQVEPYLLAGGATEPAQEGQLTPRQYAITYLVRVELYTDYLQRAGADTGQTAVDAARTAVTAGQEAQLEQVKAQAAQVGLTEKFVDLLVTFTALQKLSGDELGLDATEANTTEGVEKIVAAVDDGAPTVTLSPRYGTWVPAQQSVDPTATGPDYLQLTTAATPAA